MKKLVFACLGAVLLAGCGQSNSNTLKMITEATFPPYEFLRGQEIVGSIAKWIAEYTAESDKLKEK